MLDLDAALRALMACGGSDLHLKVPSRPLMRIDGRLVPIEGTDALEPADTESAVRQMLTDPRRLDELSREHEVDFSYSRPGLARFRVNAFRQRGSISIVVRAIPFSIRSLDDLRLPAVVRELAEEERGIVLLSGATGSGKSTTLAAMIDHINATRARHIVTIEDPIEFLHSDKMSAVNQREVGMDTVSFASALRRVLRQDPDVILIGELRDEETVRTALSAAETGHLVFSTVPTIDAGETVNRVVEFFEPRVHDQIRTMLAGSLRGVVSQRLVPAADGRGRVAACEVMRMTGRAKDMIMDSTQTNKLHEVIADGEYYGMQTFDQALFRHLKAGRITMEQALESATSPHDFQLMVDNDGRRETSIDPFAEVPSVRASVSY